MFSYHVEDESGGCDVALSAAAPLRMRVGRVRMLRSLEYKGKFFAPFIPTTQLLLLFPGCASRVQRDTLADEAVGKMSTYLRHLFDTSRVRCRIDDAALCTFSGCAVLLLGCDSVTDALQVLSVWGEVDAQDETMRMSSLYIQCYPCCVEPAGDGAACGSVEASQPLPLLSDYYYIPTCVVCADRRETVLTGQVAESALCTCAATRRRCTCLQQSLCTVCEMFVRAQTVHVATPQPVKCQACGQSGDPWVCMVCGFVGCSRYQAMHAKDHCLRRAHFFSMNLLTQQIWDYHSDAFVHRVLLNVSASTGNTARVQFPDRNTPLVEGMDDDDDDDSGGGGGASASASAHTASSTCAGKKCVSAKYDAKLSTSHTQYAQMLKNELDAMRKVLASKQPAHATARDTHAAAVDAPHDAGGYAAQQLSQGQQQQQQREARRTAQALQPQSAAAGSDSSVYAALRSLDDVVRAHTHAQRDATALCCSLRNLRDELQLSTQQSARLEAEERALQQQLRATIARNATEELKVQSSIAELEATVHEIELNVRTQRRIAQQLGSSGGVSDGVARVVIAGGGQPQQRGGGGRSTRGRGSRAAR